MRVLRSATGTFMFITLTYNLLDLKEFAPGSGFGRACALWVQWDEDFE